MRFLGGAALAAVTLLALTGCGSQATPPSTTPTVTVAPSTTPPSSTPEPTVTVTVAPTSTPTPPAVTAADPNTPKNQCPNSSLGVSVVPSADGGAAGSVYYEVLFTNTGGSSCALRGTPGVSVVGDGNGTQLGAAAARNQTDVTTITLAVGQSVSSTLKVVNIGTNGGPLDGCTVKHGDGYRIYPPHSTKSIYAEVATAVACAPGPSFMTVGPVVRHTS